MTNIKYELIPTDEDLPNKKKPQKWLAKIGFISVVLLILALYTLSTAQHQHESCTVVLASDRSPWEPSMETSTVNTPSPLDTVYDTSTLSSVKVTESYKNSYFSAVTEPESGNGISTEEQTEKSAKVLVENFTETSTFSQDTEESTTKTSYALETESGVKYFVNSPQCQMSHPNAFARNILSIYRKHHYIVCDGSRDMITVNFNETDSTYRLHQNENSTCCFKQILRAGVSTKADHQYK